MHSDFRMNGNQSVKYRVWKTASILHVYRWDIIIIKGQLQGLFAINVGFSLALIVFVM